MTISLKTELVVSEGIKIKHSYVLAIKSKIVLKPAFKSINKKLIACYIVGFMNWKQKAEAYAGDNQATQTQI